MYAFVKDYFSGKLENVVRQSSRSCLQRERESISYVHCWSSGPYVQFKGVDSYGSIPF